MSKRNKSLAAPKAVAPESTAAPAGMAPASAVATNGASRAIAPRQTKPIVPDGNRLVEANVRETALRSLNDDLMALSGLPTGSTVGNRNGAEKQIDPAPDANGALETLANGEGADPHDNGLTDHGPDGPAAGVLPDEPEGDVPADGESGNEGQEGEREESAAEPEAEPPAAADLEDLDALAELDEEALHAHAQAQRWPESYLRRVKKFTRQQKAALGANAQLLEERERMQAEIEGLRGPAAGASPGSPANGAAVSSAEQEILTAIAKRREAIGTIEEHMASPQGLNGEPLQRGDRLFTMAELRDIKRDYEWEAMDARQSLKDLRRANETARRQFEAQAAQAHPWLRDRANPDVAAIEAALREYPVLNQIPRIRLILADHVAYQKQAAKLNGTNGSNGKPAVAPKPAARAPARPVAAPLPASRSDSDGRAAVSQALKSGKFEDGKRAVLALVEGR